MAKAVDRLHARAEYRRTGRHKLYETATFPIEGDIRSAEAPSASDGLPLRSAWKMLS